MGLFASNPPSLIPAKQQSAGSVNQTASRLNAGSRAVKDTAAQSMFQSTGGALSSLQDQIDNIMKVLRSPIPQPDAYSVADPNGNLIAWIGFNIVNNVVYQGGWFKQFYVGGTSAANAVIVSDASGNVTINGATVTLVGPNGVILLDPNVPAITVSDNAGNQWAALEIIEDAPKTITAATNASPVVVTINAHGYVNGDTIIVAGATGNTAINGYRIVQNITANTFTITSIAGAVVNGNGAYAGTATATRYYAGGLFQSIAVGTSFSNYKLRAFADGSLKITDATIVLNGAGGTITLDPSIPSFVLDDLVSFQVEISPTVSGVQVRSTAGGSSLHTLMKTDSFRIFNNTGDLNVRLQSNSSIHDGRLSIYDNAGNETFIVLGQAGECFAGALFAGMQAVNPFAGSYLQVRTGTDENFSVYAHNVLADGIVLHSFNDAVTLPKGMEFRASTFRFDVGKIGVGVTATYDVDALGDVNAGGVLRVAGTQVVGAQLGSVSAPTINTTTATGTAGATYTATEQGMLNQHVTAINQLNTDVTNLATTVNTLRSRLSTTGITA